MENYFFIIRGMDGRDVIAAEMNVHADCNLFATAHELMTAANDSIGHVVSECCEIWFKSDRSHMELIATVF